eukprot:XP_019919530.1 PREDICTED: neurogenic locus notch homolog protein 1 [Crassostrea gigas]
MKFVPLVAVICLSFCFMPECQSKSAERQFDSYSANSRYARAANGKEKKDKKFDPKELEKPLLDENSIEEEYAERMLVFLDGQKTKPKNMNLKQKKKSMEADLMDRHPRGPANEPRVPTKRKKRVFVSEENVKWPNRIIPYTISSSTYANTNGINSVWSTAVNRFNEAGCVKWVPHTSETHFIEVVGNSARCASYVGYLRRSAQTLWLYENGCVYVDTALHEMLHAAGTMHEQSRIQDRENIISFNWAPVSSGSELNYEGYPLYNAREYDLSSVLQYGLTYGSTTYMYVNDPDLAYLTRITQNDLSFYDKAELNAFYRCADDCTNPPVCQNGGFVKQVDGVCSCECVDGLTGSDCTQLDTSSGCGGTIDLTSPGASDTIIMNGYQTGLTCTWLIKGPVKTKIRVNVDSLGLPTSSQGNCYHYIEIRDYLSGSKGKLICGNSGGASFTKKNLGPTNMMIVRFNSAQYNTISPGSGFSLTVTAEPSACSSSPCKYPATCTDGATINDYTCVCTAGYSGTNCDTVDASATVSDSFEDDFTTLMTHGTSGVDFQWSTNKYHRFNTIDKTASDGDLMAALRNNFFSTPFYYNYVAKMETSVVFESANRCLRFDYAIADNNIGGTYTTRLTVRVYSDAAPSTNEFITNTGNEWVTAEIDLPAVNNMKVEFEGRFGYQGLAVDNIRISPLLCNGPDPCDGVVCQNGGVCDVSGQCNCQLGFSGEFCENDVCSGNTCVNGVCDRTSSTEYTCQCDSGWYGSNCDVDPCLNTNCNQGSCEALSETQTQCNCDPGWFGSNCDVDPCLNTNCNQGSCEALSETQTQCNCDPGWFGSNCDVDPCLNTNCNQGSCESLSETQTQCNCDAGWFGPACDVDPCAGVNCNNGACMAQSETQTQCSCNDGWSGDFCDLRKLIPMKEG